MIPRRFWKRALLEYIEYRLHRRPLASRRWRGGCGGVERRARQGGLQVRGDVPPAPQRRIEGRDAVGRAVTPPSVGARAARRIFRALGFLSSVRRRRGRPRAARHRAASGDDAGQADSRREEPGGSREGGHRRRLLVRVPLVRRVLRPGRDCRALLHRPRAELAGLVFRGSAGLDLPFLSGVRRGHRAARHRVPARRRRPRRRRPHCRELVGRLPEARRVRARAPRHRRDHDRRVVRASSATGGSSGFWRTCGSGAAVSA